MSSESEIMKQPTTPDELLAMHNLCRSDPYRYLSIVNRWIENDPTNIDTYFSRHFGWLEVGDLPRALSDLDYVISHEGEPNVMSYFSRGLLHRQMQQYEKSVQDFDTAETIDPKGWGEDVVFGLYFQADAHARLGNEAAALACCARLPDDFWTPGIHGAPRGGKAEVAEELRRMAAKARRKRGTPSAK